MTGFFLHRNSKGMFATELGPNGLAFAYLATKNKPIIEAYGFHPASSMPQLKSILVDIVGKNHVQKVACNLILHPDNYKLLLVNAPNVPENEYKDAVRWQIKDMINFPIDDAAIDVFFPEETQKRIKKVYVLAAQKSYLESIATIATEAGLKLTAIDIREFAMRNIIANIAPENEMITFLNIVEDSTLMVSTKYKSIQFVRRIPSGLKQFKNTKSLASLTFEIQRSLHYCDTELKLLPPSQFFITPTKELTEEIFKSVAAELGKEVKMVDMNSVASFADPISLEVQSLCWSAIGGALRKEGSK